MIPVYLLNTSCNQPSICFKKKSNKAKCNKVYLFYYTQYKVCIVGSYIKIYYTSDYFFSSVTTPKLRCRHSVCEIQSILRGLSSSYSYLKTIFSTASLVIVFKSKQHLIPPLLHPLCHTQKMSILHFGTPWLTWSTCCLLLQTHFLQCLFFFFHLPLFKLTLFLDASSNLLNFFYFKVFPNFPLFLECSFSRNSQSPHPCLSNPLSSILNSFFPPSNNLL